MVDIHSHLLPAVDDGSKSWEMTLEMCAIARQDGIRHIVCTPHCDDQYEYDRPSNESLLEKLRQSFDGTLEFSLGCDFHLSYDNVQDALANPRRYVIANGPYILVEFSNFSIPPSMSETLRQLMLAGMVPVITHPERNPILCRKPEMVLDWIRLGCICQLTANSITGFWGKKALEVSQWLLAREAVHVIATDAHDPRHRTPVLSEARDAVASIMGNQIADCLVQQNPAAIVAGAELPYRP